MRILVVMDPGIPIPPKGYGGIERVVASLVNEYILQGHEVELLASKGSLIKECKIHVIGPEGFPPKRLAMYQAIFRAWVFLWQNRKRFDLVHNFGRLLYLLPLLPLEVKKIMTYQREITTRNIAIFHFLPNRNIVFTGCSADLIKRADPPGNWQSVYNPVDFTKFNFTENLPSEAPLIFLGRLERIKGCHTAINIAKATGNRLIIAGNISNLTDEISYFEKELKPLIDDINIIYVGEVNDVKKNEWLGKAKALLMPIEWDEPFGIVMIEAMACGTPVIGFRRGSIDEVIVEGVTGFKVDSLAEMVEKIGKISLINRKMCWEYVKLNFNSAVIAKQYLQLFEKDDD